MLPLHCFKKCSTHVNVEIEHCYPIIWFVVTRVTVVVTVTSFWNWHLSCNLSRDRRWTARMTPTEPHQARVNNDGRPTLRRPLSHAYTRQHTLEEVSETLITVFWTAKGELSRTKNIQIPNTSNSNQYQTLEEVPGTLTPTFWVVGGSNARRQVYRHPPFQDRSGTNA